MINEDRWTEMSEEMEEGLWLLTVSYKMQDGRKIVGRRIVSQAEQKKMICSGGFENIVYAQLKQGIEEMIEREGTGK